MALNKAHTSVWVKVLIIVLIISFVSLFMYSGVSGLFDLFNSPANTGTTAQTPAEAVAAINAQNQPAVDALKKIADSQPTSFTAAVNLADAYFNWAQALSTPSQGQSQLTTTALAAAVPLWSLARAAYDAASKLNANDPAVQTDRSVATFYSNDATAAIAIARKVLSRNPNFAQAWVNIGQYYESTNQVELAILAYKKFLVLDPRNSNASKIQAHLKELGASSTNTSQ